MFGSGLIERQVCVCEGVCHPARMWSRVYATQRGGRLLPNHPSREPDRHRVHTHRRAIAL